MSSKTKWTESLNISLELMGNCSPAFTLVCRHDEQLADPVWVHNGTAKSGQFVDTAFPDEMYSFFNKTEHRAIVGNNTAKYNGYRILCLYSITKTLFKSDPVTYFYAPANYQPSLKLNNTEVDYPNGNATVTYSIENCYPRCVNVSAKVEPADNVILSEEGADCNRAVSLSQLRRCQDYRLDIISNNTALLSQNLTAPPGDFIIDYCENQSLAGQTYLLRVGLRNMEPDCPDFAGETYRVEVDGETVAHLSARPPGQGVVNGFFQLDLDPIYPLPENASILRVTRLNGESGAGESRRFSLPCDRVCSSGSSHAGYTLTNALVLFFLLVSA